MSWSTYYTSTSTAPREVVETHEEMLGAINAWVRNCNRLLLSCGGASVLRDHQDGTELVWTEKPMGERLSGALAERLLAGVDRRELTTPAKVVAYIS